MAEFRKMKFMSIGEVSEILGVSVATLRAWDEKGILPSSRFGQRRIRRYSEESVRNFVESQREVHCCFCGTTKEDKVTMISSVLGTFICEPCVRGCVEILESMTEAPDSIPAKAIKPKSKSSERVREK